MRPDFKDDIEETCYQCGCKVYVECGIGYDWQGLCEECEVEREQVADGLNEAPKGN